jgi:hypothetical protein
MIRIKFKPTMSAIEPHLKEFVATIRGDELTLAVQKVHNTVETMAKKNLLSSSTRDPQATKQSIYGYDKMVANNITSVVTKRGNVITGGTGNIAYMDKQDPLQKMRKTKDIKVRLWRILEYGVQPFSTLKAKNPKEPMVFWWRRKNMLFIGKSRRVGVKGTAFVYLPPYDQAIDHPGQLGRFYWFKTDAEAEKEFRLNVSSALKRIVGVYSGK